MNRWESNKTVIGWLIVFKTPCGEFWFKPDKNGNVRFAAAMATGHTIDLRALSAVVEQVKARYGVKRFGRKCSPLRGELCGGRAQESQLQQKFERYRISGEWFRYEGWLRGFARRQFGEGAP